MEAIAGGQRLALCKAGHGVGKSHCAAVLMLWFLYTRIDCKIVVTSPTQAQLQDGLMAEIKKLYSMLPEALQALVTVRQERLELTGAPERGFISARVARADSPTALQGIHAPNVMICIDEASGVPLSVWEASFGSLSSENACCILLGNPVYSSGFFHSIATSDNPDWKIMTVPCIGNPLVSESYIQEMRDRYGERSNQWKIRVLGEFPIQDDDTVISAERIKESINREVVVPEDYPIVIGVDVARFGSDQSVILVKQSRMILEINSYHQLDVMELSGRLLEVYESYGLDVSEILCDSIGVGGGVIDVCKNWGLPIRGVNVSESPMSDRYANLRAELYFRMAEWFEEEEVSIPDHKELIRDLSAVRYLYRPNGKIAIESKSELVKRIGASPDVGDALALTFQSNDTLSRGRFRPFRPHDRPMSNLV